MDISGIFDFRTDVAPRQQSQLHHGATFFCYIRQSHTNYKQIKDIYKSLGANFIQKQTFHELFP